MLKIKAKKSKEQLRAEMPGVQFGPPPLKGPEPHIPPVTKNISLNLSPVKLQKIGSIKIKKV